ncbi:hypothetical protein H4Q26_015350 [Puccinia striiformis f. sp. tritici PST-130]|nr:hypothetical protein H4Q26_015350 [Puccinia striiformis f. sp. tritici PST-130]
MEDSGDLLGLVPFILGSHSPVTPSTLLKSRTSTSRQIPASRMPDHKEKLAPATSVSSISARSARKPPPEYLAEPQSQTSDQPEQPIPATKAVIDEEEYLSDQNTAQEPTDQNKNPDQQSETDADGQSDDDYDWDNDDDLEGDARFNDLNDKDDGHHRRRRAFARRFSPYAIGKFLITTFIGNIMISVVCLVPPFVLRYRGYYQSGDSSSARKTRFIYDNVAAWLFWASFNILAMWVLNFLTELIPRIIVLLVGIVWGDVGESFKGKVETFHTAKPWIKVMLYSAMCWGSWEIFFKGIYGLHTVMENGQFRAPYTETVHIIVRLLFFCMLILSMEKLALLTISMSFQQVAYAERIQKINRTFAVIDALKEYRPKRKPSPTVPNVRRAPIVATPKSKWWTRNKTPTKKQDKKDDNKEKRGSLNDEMTSYEATLRETDGYSNEDQKEMPFKDLKRPSKLLRRNSQTTFASSFASSLAQRGAAAAKIARAALKNPVLAVGKNSGLKMDVNNPSEARKLARKIYFGFKADSNRTYLIPSDFYPAFPNHQLAREAFSIFDADGNGDLSATEVKNEIFRAYKERRALANSLKDVGQAVGKLDRIMMAMAGIAFIFIALAIIGIDYSSALTSIYGVGIAAAFIFQDAAGNVFDAIIMVFCTHPYDTGDRVIMDNEGVDEVLIVKRMGLLVTVFSRTDGTEWFAPNSLLGEKSIINLRRSSHQREWATVQFDWDTPLEKLDRLEDSMNLWLQTDEQRRFEPGTACLIQSLDQQFIEITLAMTHRENWQDWGARFARRTAFHAALNYYTRQLGISYHNSEQPIEIYNVDEFRDQLLNLKYINPEEEEEEEAGNNEKESGDDVFDPEDQQPPNSSIPVNNKKGLSILTSNTTRAPEFLGFSAPPQSGTGMRQRKKLSKKQAMFGGD